MSLSLDGTTGISASGNITGGNVIASGSLVVGSFTPASVSTAGNVTGGNILTGGLISVTGNITGGNISATNHTGTTVSVTGAVTGASVVGGVMTGTSLSVTGAVSGASASLSGNITGGNVIITGVLVDTTGNLDLQTTAANGNINLLTNGTGIVATSANITGGNLSVFAGSVTLGSIVNYNANATGNIGSATGYFNTVFAKATSAQYADLAEMYCADSEYTPGTVLDFGGNQEVTITTQSHSTQVAGIVSTNPSYLMNSTLTCTNAVQVALVGRVPCHVVGTIAKGDRLVSSSTPGIATRLDMSQYQPGCIIGKALEAYDSETVGTIEVAVGRI